MPAAEFIPSFHALFTCILFPDYPDPGLLLRDQFYPGGIIQRRKANWERSRFHDFPEKTQQSGRQEIYIRHLPIAPEDKKGQQKIVINSR
jgi:hypothetical protein